mmetsp:Transcript_6690/g.18326  ORF Transcript_6690/g.18326 Transcript_6690/m.18326 type:complete len:359 (-) Transcript_6690:265-1341(-)
MMVPLPTPDGPTMMSGRRPSTGSMGWGGLAGVSSGAASGGAGASGAAVGGATASGAAATAGAGRLAKRPGAGTGCVSESAAFGGAFGTISRFSAKPNRRQNASYCSSTSLSFVFRKLPGVTSSFRGSSGAAPSSMASNVRLSSASFSMQSWSTLSSLPPRSALPFVSQTSFATRSLLKVSQTPSQASSSQSPRFADHSYTSGTPETFCPASGSAESCLNLKAPKARLHASCPSTRGGSNSSLTKPPAASIRAFSSASPGRWSRVASKAPPSLRHSTARESPQLATQTFSWSALPSSLTMARVAVAPDSEPSGRPARISRSHAEKAARRVLREGSPAASTCKCRRSAQKAAASSPRWPS